MMFPTSLSISCVVYDTADEILATTIRSLSASINFATQQGVLQNHTFYLVNNQPNLTDKFQRAANLAKSLMPTTEVISGHGNLGYGRANNLAINATDAEFHLVLNPDVELNQTAIYEGIKFLVDNPQVDLVAPDAANEKGDPEYLAKRYPSPLIIFLRGINKPALNKLFSKQLESYTYQDKLPTKEPMDIELASGCFMLCRTHSLKKAGGFSDRFFLYFEDFDLSRRLNKKMLLPSMKIVHLGGQAARKGLGHIKLFLRSYWTFLTTS